jgi:hypothetical protein
MIKGYCLDQLVNLLLLYSIKNQKDNFRDGLKKWGCLTLVGTCHHSVKPRAPSITVGYFSYSVTVMTHRQTGKSSNWKKYRRFHHEDNGDLQKDLMPWLYKILYNHSIRSNCHPYWCGSIHCLHWLDLLSPTCTYTQKAKVAMQDGSSL